MLEPPPMARVPMDESVVADCRRLAAEIADEVQGFIDRHTTVGVERTVARAYGIDGADDQGAPLVNLLVERVHAQKLLGRGIAFFLGRELLRGAPSLQEAAERLAYGAAPVDPSGPETLAQIQAALAAPTLAALARIDAAVHERDGKRERLAMGPTPHKYVIVATGNIYDDAVQAKSAAHGGADVVAVIRATAQSLLDYVPHGPTTEGYGGTYATQANFKIVREALDAAGAELSRYVMQTNYSSGLCMSEIAWMAAVERLDMLLNDSMYGILFRDINMERTFVDQYFSRRLIARAKIVVNTGEDNSLTTADAVEAAHTVLSSQFINEAFAHRAGVADEQLGLGHAYEINPWIEDSFLLELSQAQLVRQLFPKHPIKWMPPTKHKTGDIFHSHVHDALYNLVGVTTNQSIELLGMFTEAIHNPLLMDRYLSLKSARYIFGAAKHLGEELEFKKDGIIERRAQEVLANAHAMLVEVQREGIWDAIARGAFAEVKRARDGGKGLAGVTARAAEYVNPLLDALEGRA